MPIDDSVVLAFIGYPLISDRHVAFTHGASTGPSVQGADRCHDLTGLRTTPPAAASFSNARLLLVQQVRDCRPPPPLELLHAIVMTTTKTRASRRATQLCC